MILAVLTYPKHFHVAQLAVMHAMRHIPNITRVAVIWDDTHGIEPEMPLHLILRMKQGLDTFVINWSDIIPHIKGERLIRGKDGQQLIKLHLDCVLEDEFVILDGDTIINHNIDPANIMYSSRMTFQHNRFDVINYVLGIPNYEFWTNPFMYVKAGWLRDLRSHVEGTTGRPIADFFNYQDSMFPVYEWELIARYVRNILKLARPIEIFDRAILPHAKFEENYGTEKNIVLDGPDLFTREFMDQCRIVVDEKLYSQL